MLFIVVNYITGKYNKEVIRKDKTVAIAKEGVEEVEVSMCYECYSYDYNYL